MSKPWWQRCSFWLFALYIPAIFVTLAGVITDKVWIAATGYVVMVVYLVVVVFGPDWLKKRGY